MPSIDERVVELEFDNSDFSRKVSQTVGDLKTLDDALKMGGSADGIKEVSGAISRVNMNPLIAAAESVNNKFSTMRVIAATAISKITDTVMNSAHKLFTAIPNQIISGGWTRAANIAKAKFTFEGLAEKTGDTWESAFKDIDYAVKGTAYTFDAAAMAASSFYASGVKLGPDMQAALRGISGVAAMTSSEYSDIANIFTTVAGNGRLMAQQLNQISARGINAAAVLAEAYGVTEGELREMVSRGEVDFSRFAKAMDDAFGEHATEANKTFQGAFANIKAALSKTGELFAAPLMDAMIPVLNGIRNVFGNFKDQLGPIVNVWKDLLNTLSPVVSQFFENIASFINSNEFAKGIENIASKFETVKNVVSDFVTGKPKFVTLEDWKKLADAPYLDMLKDKLVEIASSSDENFKAMYDSYDSFEASLESGWLTKDIFSQAVNDLKGVADGLDELGESAEITSGYLEECWQHVWEVERGDWGNGQERFDRLTEAGLSYHDIQGLVNHDLLGWDYTLEGLNTTLKESGKYTDEQIAALEAFAKELEDSGSSLEEFMNIFDAVDKMSNLELIMGTLGNVAEFLREIFVDVSTAFSQVFSGGNASAFETFGEALHYWLERLYVWSTKLDGFGSNGNVVYTVAKKLFGYLKTVGSAVSIAMTGIFNAVKNVFSAFEPLVPIVGKIVTGFVELITGLEDSGKEMSILETIATAFATVIEKVSGALKPIIQAFADWVTQGNYVEKFFDGLSNVIATLKPIFKSVGESIRVAWEIARPYVAKFVQELPGKFMAAFNAVKDFIVPIVQTISGALSDLFSSTFGGTDLGDSFSGFFSSIETGEGILESFGDLVETVFEKIKDVVSSFFDLFNKKDSFGKITDPFEGLEGNTAGKGVVDALRSFSDECDRVSEKAGPVITAIQNLLGAFQGTTEIVANVVKYFSNMDLAGFEEFWGYLTEGASIAIMFTAVKGFKDLAGGIGSLAESLGNLPSMTPWGSAASAMSEFGKAIRPGKFFEIAMAISAVALSIWLLSTIPIPRLWNVIGAMVAMAAVIGGLVYATSKIAQSMTEADALKMEQMGRTLIMFAASIAIVAIAAYMLEHVKWESLGKAALVFAALVAGAKILSAGAKDIGAAASVILAFAFALLLLVVPITILGSLPILMLVQGIGALVGVMLGMAGAFKLMGKANLAGTAGAILAFAIALTILSGVIVILGSLNPTQLVQGLLALAGVAVILVGGLILLVGAAQLLKFSAASFTALGAAALFLGVGLLAAATAVFILSQIGDGLWPAIGAFTVIAAVLAGLIVVLSFCAEGLAVAGVGMLAFGAGCMLVAASLLVAAAGLSALAVIAPIAGEALLVLARSLARSATILGKAFGEAIAAFITAVGEAAAPIAEAMWNMAKEAMSRLAQGFMDNIGPVTTKLADMFVAFADGISPELPRFIEAGVQIVVSLIEGISSQLGPIVQAGFDLTIAFINAIADALENNGTELRAACDHLVQSIIEFIIEFITGKEVDLDEPSQGIGHAIVDGILGGFTNFGGPVLDAVEGFAGNILDRIRFGLGIGGDKSSEGEKLGETFINSFGSGVEKSKEPITNSVEALMGSVAKKIDPKPIGAAATGVVGVIGSSFSQIQGKPLQAISGGMGSVLSTVSSFTAPIGGAATGITNGLGTAFSSAKSVVTGTTNSMMSNVSGTMSRTSSLISSHGRTGINNYVNSIRAGTNAAASAARTVSNSVSNALKAGAGAAKSAGTSLVNGFTSAIRSGSGGARGAASSVASNAAGGFSGYSAWWAGYNLSSGFASGIRSGSYLASAAASAVASAALSAIKSRAREASPSKITRQYGEWFTEGWIIGIMSLRDESAEAAEEIGKNAVDTIGAFAKALSNGVDMSLDYNPTITPIVDLDNVKAAGGYIDQIMSNSYGFGLGSTLGRYSMYGDASSSTNVVTNNVSVTLQYQAGSDANMMAEDLASALTSKLNLEG